MADFFNNLYFCFNLCFFTPSIHVQTFPLTLLSVQNPLGYSPCRPACCRQQSRLSTRPKQTRGYKTTFTSRLRRIDKRTHYKRELRWTNQAHSWAKRSAERIFPTVARIALVVLLAQNQWFRKEISPFWRYAMVYWCNLVSLTAGWNFETSICFYVRQPR